MLYKNNIPVFVHYLSVLIRLLDKGRGYAGKKKWSEKKLLSVRLAPNMYNLTQQIQYAYFMALEAATSLSGRKMPDGFNYDEKTIRELKASLARAIKYLKTIKPGDFKGAEKKKIKTFLLSPRSRVSGEHYVSMLAIPNFFFHVTTAYDILRHLGVSIGKDDYLGL